MKDLTEKVAKQKAIVFADFTGLKVKDLSTLKAKLKQVGAEFKVAKKTLMNLAFKETNVAVEPSVLTGEVALVLGYADETSAAKITYEFSQVSKNLKILGGYVENRLLGVDEVVALAKLPSKQQLLANLVGTMSAPARGFASVLQGNIRGLVYLLSQIKAQEVK